MEYTIQEMQAMLNIVSAVLSNRHNIAHMKTGTSNYTPKCLEFSKYFKGKQGITTHQSEDIDYNDFRGRSM